MAQQQYCLRWKYHHSNLQTMFSQLLDRECFCDVTLACEGRTLRAHRVVLCACSTYFDSILTSGNSDKETIVIMKDCRFDDVKCLIDFMYKGEINVEHEQLASLLRTAEDLRIKGLAEVSWHDGDGDDKRSKTKGQITPANNILSHSNASTPATAIRLPPKRNSISSSNSNQNHLSSDETDPLGDPSIVSVNERNDVQIVRKSHNNHSESSQNGPNENHDEQIVQPVRKKRGRPPLDDDFDSYSTPKISLVEGAVNTRFQHSESILPHDPPLTFDENSNTDSYTRPNAFLEQRMEVRIDDDDDDITEIIPKIERPDTPISVRNDSSNDQFDSRSPDDDNDMGLSSHASDDLLTPQEEAEWSDVIKMNDYLAKGRRPQFWEESFTKRVMEAIKSKELEMKKAAQLLGVSYGTLYGRYRETYGCLKHPYRGPILLSTIRDFLADGHEDIIRKYQRGEITLPRAAELMNTSATHLSDILG